MNKRTKPTAAAEKLPPHSTEAEAGVLACVILAPECLRQCLEALPDSGAFFEGRHRTVYEAVCAMHTEGIPIDPLTLHSRLKETALLDEAGGIAYVSGLPDQTPSALNLGHYLAIVAEKHRLRRVLQTCGRIQERITEANGHAPAALLEEIHADLSRLQTFTKCEANAYTVRRPDELLAMEFDESDRILGDRILATGQSLVIAGQGGVGKSRLLLQMAACCLTGREFLGLATRGVGKHWLILQVENSNRRLRNDLETLRQWCGPEAWAAVNEDLTIHTLENDRDGIVNLDAPDNARRLADLVAEHNPAIVAFDSLYNFATGDLNNDADMQATLHAISRVARNGNADRAIVILHHALTGRAGASKSAAYDALERAENRHRIHYSKVTKTYVRQDPRNH